MQCRVIRKVFVGLILWVMAFGVLIGCESGDKVIDEATGNRALEQYKATQKKLDTIDAREKEKYQTLQENEAGGK